MPTYDFNIRDIGGNGEFISWATIDLLVDGKVTETETFTGNHEEAPGYSGQELAASYGIAWVESNMFTLEERLGPFGLEWEREQADRFAEVPF
jgi:hypothetical protein